MMNEKIDNNATASLVVVPGTEWQTARMTPIMTLNSLLFRGQQHLASNNNNNSTAMSSSSSSSLIPPSTIPSIFGLTTLSMEDQLLHMAPHGAGRRRRRHHHHLMIATILDMALLATAGDDDY